MIISIIPLRSSTIRPDVFRLFGRWTALALLLGLGAGARAQMPPGPGKAIFEKSCTECHGEEVVLDMKMSKEGWQSVVDNMIAEGATVSDDDTKVLVDYLAKNFGQDAQKVNVNQETAHVLETRLGLSDKEAQAVVDYRGKHGPFRTLDDLKKVPGLDAAKIDAKKDQIVF